MTIRQAICATIIVSVPMILPGGASAETLRWARSADALTLDPHAQNDGVTSTFLNNIYETLVERDSVANLVPRLATEWFVKEGDPNTWVFRLRDGVTFSDGAELTAEDVVFSLDRARSEQSLLRQLHVDVREVRAVDDHTVEVTLSGPNLVYPNNLTGTYILDSGWAEANDTVEVASAAGGRESYAVRNTNGTGPFVLTSREEGARSVLTARDDHWSGVPAVSELVYLPITEAATRVAALLSGEVDFLQDVPVQDIERLAATQSVEVLVQPENRSIFLGYRLDEAPLQSSDVADVNPLHDGRVREAFELAIDRDAIRQVILRGNGIATGILLPPLVHGWTEELNAYPAQDLDRARELLAEAGYPDGFSITLDAPNNRYVNDEAVAQAVVGFLSQIGIEVTLVSRPFAQHSPLLVNAESDFYLFGWGVPTFDSAYNLNDLIHSRTGNYGAWNATGYVNPDLDAKIQSIAHATDVETRDRTIGELWRFVKDEHLYLPLHNQVTAWALRGGIAIDPDPSNSPKIRSVTFASQ